MWQCIELSFAADHPTAAGHFPGNPIIPGALLLDLAVAAITDETNVSINAVKFLQAVHPGEHVDLRWQNLGSGKIRFECSVSGQTRPAMTGTLQIEGAES